MYLLHYTFSHYLSALLLIKAYCKTVSHAVPPIALQILYLPHLSQCCMYLCENTCVAYYQSNLIISSICSFLCLLPLFWDRISCCVRYSTVSVCPLTCHRNTGIIDTQYLTWVLGIQTQVLTSAWQCFTLWAIKFLHFIKRLHQVTGLQHRGLLSTPIIHSHNEIT